MQINISIVLAPPYPASCIRHWVWAIYKPITNYHRPVASSLYILQLLRLGAYAPFTSWFLYKLLLFLQNCPLSILFAAFGMSGIRQVWWTTVLYLSPPFPWSSKSAGRCSHTDTLLLLGCRGGGIRSIWSVRHSYVGLVQEMRGRRQSVPQDKNRCEHGLQNGLTL